MYVYICISVFVCVYMFVCIFIYTDIRVCECILVRIPMFKTDTFDIYFQNTGSLCIGTCTLAIIYWLSLARTSVIRGKD